LIKTARRADCARQERHYQTQKGFSHPANILRMTDTYEFIHRTPISMSVNNLSIRPAETW